MTNQPRTAAGRALHQHLLEVHEAGYIGGTTWNRIAAGLLAIEDEAGGQAIREARMVAAIEAEANPPCEVCGAPAWTGRHEKPEDFGEQPAYPGSQLPKGLAHLAALAAAPPAEPLDVERLARALIGSDLMPRYHEYAMRVPTMNPSETVEHLAAVWAEWVAAEYARLASADEEETT